MKLILLLVGLIVVGILFMVWLLKLLIWIGKPIQVGKVPLKYVPYEDSVSFYRREGLLYQRIGPELEIQIVILSNGDVHKLGKPTEIDPDELVQVEKIKKV